MNQDLNKLLTTAISTAKGSGEVILSFYSSPKAVACHTKSDHTPVTEADLASHDYIRDKLIKLTPGIPILSEEDIGSTYEDRKHWRQYWLVDPLDGTREFIARNGQFVVCIALIRGNESVLGVIHHPVSKTTYYAASGLGAFCENKNGVKLLKVRGWEQNNTEVLCSKHHKISNKAVDHLPINVTFNPMGSALKFCALAAGEGDIYPGFGLTSEWDIAAGQCILEEAGGLLTDAFGEKFRYNMKPDLKTHIFWAVNDKNLLDFVLKNSP